MTDERKKAELMKAADTKVAIPDVNNIRALAKELLDSGLFPGVKSSAGAVTIIQAGYELGIPPVAALNTMVIINGRLAMEAKALLAIAANKLGVTWKVVKEDANGCEISFSRPGFEPAVGSFTREDAKKANLLGKSNWNLYEKDMFFARAAGRGIKRIAPDAILGMVTKEEAEELVDFNAEPEPAAFAAAAVSTAELDELKKKVEELAGKVPPAVELVPAGGAQVQAGKVADIKDEFSDPGAADDKPGPDDPCSMEYVKEIGDLVRAIVATSVEEGKVWGSVAKKVAEKYHKAFGEVSDLTQAQAEDVAVYLNRWLHKAKASIGEKA